MNLWRHQESNVGEQEDDTHLDSSTMTEEVGLTHTAFDVHNAMSEYTKLVLLLISIF